VCVCEREREREEDGPRKLFFLTVDLSAPSLASPVELPSDVAPFHPTRPPTDEEAS
jgi:hypothetical protein